MNFDVTLAPFPMDIDTLLKYITAILLMSYSG